MNRNQGEAFGLALRAQESFGSGAECVRFGVRGVWGLVGLAIVLLIACAEARSDDAPARVSADRQRALADLRSFRLGSTLTFEQRLDLEALKLPAHEHDDRLIAAYKFEALAGAYWLFCEPKEESRQATELQVYLGGTTTLQGRDAGVPPPANDVDGLRGARVVFRRFVRCDHEVKPYFLTVYGVIPFTFVPGKGTGPTRTKAQIVAVPPPDNVRIRSEIDEGAFIAMPFDFDCENDTLHPHVHYMGDGKSCRFGTHGRTLACDSPANLKPGILRAESLVASPRMCSSCHMEGAASMTDPARFTWRRETMEGFLKFPKLAQEEMNATELDLADIREQLKDPANTFVPADLPKAIEDAWLAAYPEYLKCKEALKQKASP
jgi:hypothetical protein